MKKAVVIRRFVFEYKAFMRFISPSAIVSIKHSLPKPCFPVGNKKTLRKLRNHSFFSQLRELPTPSSSLSLKVDFVLDTVDQLIAVHGCTIDNETIVHSDQGCHYTSSAFIKRLKDAEFVQSMSRRGNCWDNSPQETFFGHMKDDIADLIAMCDTFDDVLARIDDWMDYYNNDRGQWDLLKLTPKEYYEYLQTGIYPLPVFLAVPSRGSAPDPEV